jgi:Uma2 family endonuclease
MATITRARSKPTTPTLAPLAAPEVYRINVDEYERMAGMLDEERIELIDGCLVKKMGKKPPHVWSVDATVEALKVLLHGWWCRQEAPVRIPKFDEPEPYVSVVRGSRDDYRDRTPEPGDVVLVVEVAETTLDHDRGLKKAAYARGRIPVYWIVNLVDRQVEVYSNPRAGKYRSGQVFKPGQEVPVVIERVRVGRIAVADILP